MKKKKRIVPSDYKLERTYPFLDKTFKNLDKMKKQTSYHKRDIVNMAINYLAKIVEERNYVKGDDIAEILEI